MAKIDQLEIIAPDGKIFFHGLDPHKGVTNIGRHADNDIVIDSPTIGQFQAVLDHQRKPFRIMVLGKEGQTRLAGQPLEGDVFQEIHDWQTVDLDGYTLTLLENMEVTEGSLQPAGSTPVVIPSAGLPAQPAAQVPAAPIETAPAAVSAIFPTRPADTSDDAIVANLNDREWTVDVEQPATYELTVANGGPIVAEFELMVEGIDPDWVTITPPRVYLIEGALASARITILPPRRPETTAGVHHFAIAIISPNYQGHVARLGASLMINPYYEFTVGNLTPAQQSASWRQRSASANFPIHNQGNSLAAFQVIAQDDENGCRFEYPLNDQVNLARQVEVKLKPGETIALPLTITPLKRSLVRVRSRQYHYSVTTQSINDPAAARMIAGTFVSRSLFGTFSILAAVALLLVGIFFLFRPRLDAFTVTPDVVSSGQAVTLSWQAPLFTNEITLKNLPDAIKAGQNQVSIVPTDTLTSYTLIGRNWLSRLLSLPDVTLTSQPVLAIPPYPQITTFSVDKTDVILGQTVTVKWAVVNAATVVLTVENVPTILTPAEFSGEKTIALNTNSLIVLEARNASGSIVQSEYVRVWGPSDLKVNFAVDPPEVAAGNPVNVSWDVSGSGFTVDTVTVAPFNEPLPAKFSLKYYPTDSMYFVLKVKVRDYELSVPKYVTVLPADAKPVIDYFKATPPNLLSSGSVEFSWSVSGPTDSIDISNKSGVVQKSLAPQGFANIVVSQSATYVLTAKKGKESASAVVEVQVNNLADVNVAIVSMVPQNGILRGDSVFVYFSIAPAVVVTNGPEISGSVVITDGFDSCEVKLPITSCEMIFHRSGDDKKLTATYSGDANFRRTTSASFPANTFISVIGSTVTLDHIAINYIPPVLDVRKRQPDLKTVLADPVVGQTGYLQFDLVPVGGSSLSPVQGLFDVLVTDLSNNSTTALCLDQQLVLAINAEGVNVGRGYCPFTFGSVGDKQFMIKYRGSEIYEPLNSDPTDPTQANLRVSVGQGPTRINLLTQNPPNSAQIGQQVSLTLQVVVAVQGGIAVPGVGSVTIKDNANTLCTSPVNTQGIATCVFVPTESISNLIISFNGDGNYGNSDNSGTSAIHYEITKALVDILVSSVQFPLINPLQRIPVVGQTLTVILQVETTTFHSSVLSGTVQVFLKDSANPNPTTPKCPIVLPQTTVQCSFLVEHGGANTISIAYSDSSNTYQANTMDPRVLNVGPAPVLIQNITASSPSTVEGSQVSIAFDVVPGFPTTLDPRGSFSIATDGAEVPCSNTHPAQSSCTLTILASPAATRNFKVTFGDGIDYVASAGILSNYSILHRTITHIDTNVPSEPQAFSSTNVSFSVTPYYSSVLGMPTPAGEVVIAVTSNGTQTCSDVLDANGHGSCILLNLQAGLVTLSASYNSLGAPFTTSTFTNYTFTVAKVPATLSLQSQAPPISYLKSAATFTVTASGSGTVPGGTAVISARKLDGSQAVCQNVLQLVAGQGSCSITFNTAGDWSLYYTYSGDNSYSPITIPQPLSPSHPVIKYPTLVDITSFSPHANSTLVQISYQVSKKPVSGPALPDAISGTVTINIPGSLVPLTCPGPVNYNPDTGVGTGSCPIQFPTGGGATYDAVASYMGDINFNGSNSLLPFTITVP